MKGEKLEVTIGNRENPRFHLVSSMAELDEIAKWFGLGLLAMPASRPVIAQPISYTKPPEEPLEVIEIRHKYKLQRNRLQNEHRHKMLETDLEEELEVKHIKKMLETKATNE